MDNVAVEMMYHMTAGHGPPNPTQNTLTTHLPALAPSPAGNNDENEFSSKVEDEYMMEVTKLETITKVVSTS